MEKYIDNLDGLKHDDWLRFGFKESNYSYTTHPAGFRIFISPETTDEWEEGDPYNFSLEKPFDKARVDSTILLIKSVFDYRAEFKLLDIGCGRGFITNEISKEFRHAEISAMDYSISAIEQAYSKFQGIDFIVADAFALPYSKEYFDIVVMNNLFEHVTDPIGLLRQVKNVLKPYGYIVISTPSRYRIENITRKILGQPVKLKSKNHVTEYSVGQVVEILNFERLDIKQIYSRKSHKVDNIKLFILYNIVKPAFTFLLRKTVPLHSLESTCYFLAQKES